MGVSGALFLWDSLNDDGGLDEGKKVRVDDVLLLAWLGEEVDSDTRGMSDGRGDESEWTGVLEAGEGVWRGGGLATVSVMVTLSVTNRAKQSEGWMMERRASEIE